MLLCRAEYFFLGAGVERSLFHLEVLPGCSPTLIVELLSLDNCDSRIWKQNIQALGCGIGFCFLDSELRDDQRKLIPQYM